MADCNGNGRRLCSLTECQRCFNKSFASHPKANCWDKENEKTARQVFKLSNKKYAFTCATCFHKFDKKLNHIVTVNSWCPYCAGKKLCENEFCSICWDRSFESLTYRSVYWSGRNYPIVPRDITLGSNKKFWFTCEKGHDFNTSIYRVTTGKWCPICKHKTQEQLFSWLKERYPEYTIITEAIFDWCVGETTNKKYRYDFYLPELDLFIELDGPQHFYQISYWKCPEDTQARDIFKMNRANINGKSVIRIEQENISYDKTDWRNQLMGVIKKYEIPRKIYIGNNYESYPM